MAQRTGGRQRRRVVIIGAGFAGLACARKLDGADLDVVLIDRRNYHLFTPLLYQVATALLNPSEIAQPIRSVFRRSPNVRFREADVTGVDLDARVVRTADVDYRYDTLVLATGAANHYFGEPALAQATQAMKTLGEALRLRNRLLACLEIAAQAPTRAEAQPWLTTVVVGGGPTGVEYAGSLKELLNLTLGRDYPELDPSWARVVLVEGMDRLLGPFHPTLGRYALQTLTGRGIEVVLGARVTAADDTGVTLSDGRRIDARAVVWSAGVRATHPAGAAATTGSGRLAVDERLRLVSHSDVYAVGDVAAVAQDGAELPQMSPPAMQEGRYVAREILGTRQGPFRFHDKGSMAVIGRNAAVVDVRGLRLKGFGGWVLWLSVHIFYLIGFRNRFVVLASWAWHYVRKDRPIRLIVRSAADPLADRFAETSAETRKAPP